MSIGTPLCLKGSGFSAGNKRRGSLYYGTLSEGPLPLVLCEAAAFFSRLCQAVICWPASASRSMSAALQIVGLSGIGLLVRIEPGPQHRFVFLVEMPKRRRNYVAQSIAF